MKNKNANNFSDRVSFLRQALLDLDTNSVENLLTENGADTTLLVERLLIPTLEQIGKEWEHGYIALAQVYMCGKICEELMEKILPKASHTHGKQPCMAIATFRDYHMLGKRLVYSVLRAAGYEVRDYGRVDIEDLVAKCRDDKVELLFLSTLMLASACSIKDAIVALKNAGLNVRVAVGGAPFRYDPKLAVQIGADEVGFVSSDALAIVARAKEKRT